MPPVQEEAGDDKSLTLPVDDLPRVLNENTYGTDDGVFICESQPIFPIFLASNAWNTLEGFHGGNR
jgi:hypothetical protein